MSFCLVPFLFLRLLLLPPPPPPSSSSFLLFLLDNKILSTLGQCEPEILTTADIMWPEGESTLANLNPSLRMLCTLSELYDRELVAAIGWAKQIPGAFKLKSKYFIDI